MKIQPSFSPLGESKQYRIISGMITSDPWLYCHPHHWRKVIDPEPCTDDAQKGDWQTSWNGGRKIHLFCFYQHLWSSSSNYSQYTSGCLCCPSDWSLVHAFHYHHSHIVTQYALWTWCALDVWDYEHIVLGQQAMGSLIPEKHKLPSLLIIP